MKITFRNTLLTFLLILTSILTTAGEYRDITVDWKGTGDYETIEDAVNSIPSENLKRIVIFVKNGHYHEKIRINSDYVTLRGESMNKTIVQFEQSKKDWLSHKDYEGPAVINIHGDDVILENLTIRNTMTELGPTAYVIHGKGTRTIIQNCRIENNGANSVSLMNYKAGMYYLKNCYIEGTVDFLRAMGTCYLEQCRFFQKEAIASVWHAGIDNENQKMVLKSCSFDGVEHYFLGRHHYDAQFFLLDCHFTQGLADKAIYRKVYPKNPDKERAYIYGDRRYYHNCQRDGGNYPWLKNNLSEYAPKTDPTKITAAWTFNGEWIPESVNSPKLLQSSFHEKQLTLRFDMPISVQEPLILETSSGKKVIFKKGQGRPVLTFLCKTDITAEDTTGAFRILSGQMIQTTATAETIPVEAYFK